MKSHRLNLLPPEDLQRLGHEKLTRFLILSFSLIAAALLVGGVLMLPAYFFLTLQENDTLVQIDLAQKSVQAERVKETENTIEAINAKLQSLEAASSKRTLLSSHIAAIAEHANPGISLDWLTFTREKGQVEITGTAPTRGAFLIFLDGLRRDPYFTSIESPVNNLLKDTGVAFTLTILLPNK